MTGFLTLLAVFLVLFVAYKATMYFWTIRLFRAYAYLHRIEHSKAGDARSMRKWLKRQITLLKNTRLAVCQLILVGRMWKRCSTILMAPAARFMPLLKRRVIRNEYCSKRHFQWKVIQVNAEVKRWSPHYSRQHT